jgi:hypothetical protein
LAQSRCVMWDDGKPVRSWQEIAQEALREKDPKRFEELARELELALDVRDRKLIPQPVPLKRQQRSA